MTAPSPAPRAIAGPLLLALVFLAIIGGSAGFVLALSAGKKDSGSTQNVGEPQNPGSGQSPPGAGQGQETPDTEESPDNKPPTTDKLCPNVTQAAAVDAGSPGRLVVQLYIRTQYSQVWVCRDKGGALWYQGNRHNGSPSFDLPAATSDDTLFLGGVSQEDRAYVVGNSGASGTTYYRVSTSRLVIDNPGGDNDSAEDAMPDYTYRAP